MIEEILMAIIPPLFIIIGWFVRQSYIDFKDALKKLTKMYEDHIAENKKDFEKVADKIEGVASRLTSIEARHSNYKHPEGEYI